MKKEYLGNGCAPGSARGQCDAGSIRLMGTSLWPPILDNQPIVHTAETLYGKFYYMETFLISSGLGFFHGNMITIVVLPIGNPLH